MADGLFNTFRLPSTLGGGDVVLRELTAGEQDDIMRAAMARKGDAAGLAVLEASVIRSLVSIKGALVPPGVEGEALYRSLRPKVRQLIIDAYSAIHNPNDDEKSDFLGSLVASATPPTAL